MTLSKTLRNVPMLLAVGLLLNTFNLPAQARTINYPNYNGRRIDACPINMQCSKAGTWYVAHSYCKLVGYRKATAWRIRKGGGLSKKRHVLRLEYRPAGSVWLRRKGKYFFTKINCSF